MSNPREQIPSNSEKKFILKCLSEHMRVDGRAFAEFRPLKIQFGQDFGSCYVSLGNTIVFAQTSCEVQQPKSSRPSEGILNINVELSPMGAPHFEPGRQSELNVQLNRILEKTVKDSKAIDLESLCIKTSEKVWALRVDLNVLNHDGNILDCAGIALLASLAHFKRPDVTCNGEEFIIHTREQRDPIPVVIHHYPVTVTFAVFQEGEYLIADPRLNEEAIADALLNISLNGFNELCGLHLGGKAELTPNFILSAVNQAKSRVQAVIEEIKRTLGQDMEESSNKNIGIQIGSETKSTDFEMLSNLHERKVTKSHKKKANKKKGEKLQQSSAAPVQVIGKASAAYNSPSVMVEDDSNDVVIVNDKVECIQLSDEEEDDMVMLHNEYTKH